MTIFGYLRKFLLTIIIINEFSIHTPQPIKSTPSRRAILDPTVLMQVQSLLRLWTQGQELLNQEGNGPTSKEHSTTETSLGQN